MDSSYVSRLDSSLVLVCLRLVCVQVKQDDLLEHAETFIKALRAGKEFIADTKPFQVRK